MTRLNWNRPRRVYRPWYDQDSPPSLDAGPRPLPSFAINKPARFKPIDKPPTGLAAAFIGKATLRTRDATQARQVLSAVTEAQVWCDGSAEPNPGTMGMGCAIVIGAERFELFGGGTTGTNNSAELGAALLAIEVLPPRCRVTVYSDSQYLVFGMTQWIDAWRWKKFMRSGGPIPNADRWRRLDALNSSRSIRWEWCRGHAGNRGNEIADQLATLGRGG